MDAEKTKRELCSGMDEESATWNAAVDAAALCNDRRAVASVLVRVAARLWAADGGYPTPFMEMAKGHSVIEIECREHLRGETRSFDLESEESATE